MPNPMPTELDKTVASIRTAWEVEFEPLEVDDRALHILSITNMRAHLDRLLSRGAIGEPLRDLPLWAKVWPASIVLGRFLRKFQPEGKTMLEIGSGMGVCSLVAAGHGFKSITCTDLIPDAVNFARANILRNNLQDIVSARRLDITAPQGGDAPGWDMIAASELLYLADLHRPLLKFVNRHLAPGGKAFFCSDLARARSPFKKLAAKTFKITDGNIGVKSLDAEGNERRRIYNVIILEKS